MTRWWLLLLSLLLIAGCPHQQAAAPPAAGSGTAVDQATDGDPLLAALNGDQPDLRSFAEFFITRFQLTTYLAPLQKLAPGDPVAATVCAAVYRDLTPWREQLKPAAAPDGGSGEQRPWDATGLLGAAYGMRCASHLAPELWVEALAAVADGQRSDLLWGLAQLDAEPGGPLRRSEALDQAFMAQARSAQADKQLAALAATDALLGGQADWPVTWQRYIDLAPQMDWTGVQWAALLRWAPPEVWRAVLARPTLDEPVRISLAQAWATAGPPGTALPPGVESWMQTEAPVEYRACRYLSGSEPTIALPELEPLMQAPGSDSEAAQLSALLQALKYAGLHGDTTALDAALTALPELSSAARSGILATLERYAAGSVSDPQLTRIATLADPVVAYWLVLGWPDRKPVQQARLEKLLTLKPGSEDALLAYAFAEWRTLAAQLERNQSGG